MLANLRYGILLILLLATSFSCNQNVTEEGKKLPRPIRFDLDEIQKRGYINALVDNNSISYFIYRGRSLGYEYELLQLLADHLKVRLKIQVTSGVDRAIEQLNQGEGDVIAFPLTVTKSRTELVTFTRPHFNSQQVLIQRKPENWRKLTLDQIEDSLIRNPIKLIKKDVYVIKETSFEERLMHLSEEVGGDINIITDTSVALSESLIQKVAMGEIDYTVTDRMTARVNAAYYPNLDINTVLSVPQQIAWAVRKNAPNLALAIDEWMGQIKKEPTFMVIFNRYFNSPRTSLIRISSDYSSLGGSRLSRYDELIKEGAASLGWDWRLLAAVVYQESRFDPTGESWAGARGLMQLMPETAKQFGVTNPDDPTQSIIAGVKYLKYLDSLWAKTIEDPEERLKFVLASYNVGLSHVIDARNLAGKNNFNTTLWNDNVEYFLIKKSEPKYYQDPIVKAGYCKCQEPVRYVADVLDRYDEYKQHIQAEG